MYIGGSHEKSFIELHDIRFVIAETIGDTYPKLRETWWGIPSSLHLDAWGCLDYADGYEIQIKSTPSLDSTNKLYFINLGGYDSEQFTELHKNIFVVAETPSKAKVKALKQILHWQSFHRDYQFDIDDIISVDSALSDQNFYIHLIPTEESRPFEFTCRYMPVGAKEN